MRVMELLKILETLEPTALVKVRFDSADEDSYSIDFVEVLHKGDPIEQVKTAVTIVVV